MRSPTDLPRRRVRNNPRLRIWLIAIAAVLIVLLFSLRGIAGFYTDYLWFDEVGLTSVWRGRLGPQILLTVVFTAVFFAILWSNLLIAERLAPTFRPLGPEDEIVQRYREIIGPHAGKLRLAVAVVFALMAGVGVGGQWKSWLLFRNSVDFGQEDAQFGRDLGFYVFRLPFLTFIVDWLFVAFVIVTLVTIVAHYFNGGIRLPRSPIERVTPHVKAHISVLLGILAVIRAFDYYLRRFELSTSTRGVVNGPGYTDTHAQLPALNLLLFVSLIAAALFVANIWRKGWLLPGIAVGLWLFLSVVVGTIYPAFVQRFRVQPAENRREEPYIERNIAATRRALGLEGVKTVPFPYNENLTAADLQANAETIRNVRLWDPAYTLRTFSETQAIRDYYRLNDLDVDRYVLNGRLTQTLLSVRDLSPEGLPDQARSWVNRHLQYTHGYGAVVAPANAVRDGKPDFTVRDVPPVGEPQITQPRVYYGERLGSFAIVGSEQNELDFQKPEGQGSEFSHYEGKGGVELSSAIRRVAFALRFGDFNPILSKLVTSKSRLIFVRDIHDRVRKAAPFLRYDADPYPVILKGRILWVQDAYTTTNKYAYGQTASTEGLAPDAGLAVDFNYVRNSVKVVTDAYDGTMTFYVVDEKDPIIRAYMKAFPKLFTRGSQMSAELREHLRYPEELFRVQTTMYGRYHITEADDFYSAGDAWNVAQEPGSGRVRQGATGGTIPGAAPTGGAATALTVARRNPMDPYYLLTRLPNEEKETFTLFRPFVPRSAGGSERRNLTAFMVAKSDPDTYGQLEVFEMPRDRQIDGPSLVSADIQSNAAVSETIALLNREGSEVILGNLLVVPIRESLLYVQPLYVTSEQTEIPEFQRAIVSYAGRVAISETLQGALATVFGQAPPTLEQGPSGPAPAGPAPAANIQQLLDQALAAYQEAQTALRNGDLAGYQRKLEESNNYVRRARDAQTSSTTTTTVPARNA